MVKEGLLERQAEVRELMKQRVTEVCKKERMNGMIVRAFRANGQKWGIVKSLTIENEMLVLRTTGEAWEPFESSMTLDGAYIVETKDSDGKAFITDNYPLPWTQEWKFSLRVEIRPSVVTNEAQKE